MLVLCGVSVVVVICWQLACCCMVLCGSCVVRWSVTVKCEGRGKTSSLKISSGIGRVISPATCGPASYHRTCDMPGRLSVSPPGEHILLKL